MVKNDNGTRFVPRPVGRDVPVPDRGPPPPISALLLSGARARVALGASLPRIAAFLAVFMIKPNGMGMGLAIGRSIVAAPGGTLSALAGVPHGASFQPFLPRSR
jgi:hypothetical protein